MTFQTMGKVMGKVLSNTLSIKILSIRPNSQQAYAYTMRNITSESR